MVHGCVIAFEVTNRIAANEGRLAKEGEQGVLNLGLEGPMYAGQVDEGNGMFGHGAAV